MATATISSLFLGEDGSLFEAAKAAFAAHGRQITLVRTRETVNELLKTSKIRLVVADVAHPSISQEIIDEIRRSRPWLAVIVLTSFPHRGRSIHEVLAYNYYCIARGIDGTIKAEQFEKALEKIDAQHRVFISRVITAVVCLVLIAGLATISGSALGKFLGAFWALLLLFEFADFLILSHRYRA